MTGKRRRHDGSLTRRAASAERRKAAARRELATAATPRERINGARAYALSLLAVLSPEDAEVLAAHIVRETTRAADAVLYGRSLSP